MNKGTIVLFFWVICGGVFGQSSLDSLQQLDEVIVRADRNLKQFSNTQHVNVLNDSTIKKSKSSLTDLLNFNSLIYFKENGLGMVSSPAFRGTTAQQTAVVWNGININSQFNGQTDFNAINTLNFNEISVRSGGGSVLYGSGAIGGTIHLDNTTEFNKDFDTNVMVRYGSFNTADMDFKSHFSNERLIADISANYTFSDNDYKYVDSERRNSNGEFYNVGISARFGYKINSKNTLNYYGNIYDGERHFSLILPSETKTKYRDFNTRQLLEWNGIYNRFLSTLKVAYLTENYRYYGNINRESYTYGEAKTLIGKYQLGFRPFQDAYLEAVADINHTIGEGSSIAESERTITGFSILLKHQIDKFLYEATLRKEITNTYESPVLMSLGLQYKFAPNYTLHINGSRNFRIPTYNDLYWAGSGNLDLKPESSYQLELGNTLLFENLSFSVIGFYNDITDMIRWLPVGSVWRPDNTKEVVTYGVETRAGYEKTFGQHQFKIFANYGYTVSEDQTTNKQLIYVPYHKVSGALNYRYKRLSVYWQTMFAGEVFLLSDNNPRYVLDGYLINNLGIEYHFKTLLLGTQVRNIFNENYQGMANRYMPGIHYNFYINFNF